MRFIIVFFAIIFIFLYLYLYQYNLAVLTVCATVSFYSISK